MVLWVGFSFLSVCLSSFRKYKQPLSFEGLLKLPNCQPFLLSDLVNQVTLVAFSYSCVSFPLPPLTPCLVLNFVSLFELHPNTAHQTQQDVHIRMPTQPNIFTMVILSATVRAR